MRAKTIILPRETGRQFGEFAGSSNSPDRLLQDFIAGAKLRMDDRIFSACRDSVEETMQEVEREAKARVRRHGVDAKRSIDNLVWGRSSFTMLACKFPN